MAPLTRVSAKAPEAPESQGPPELGALPEQGVPDQGQRAPGPPRSSTRPRCRASKPSSRSRTRNASLRTPQQRGPRLDASPPTQRSPRAQLGSPARL
ncbi:hypothetical protein E4U17_005625 [Claviceps sp. LM77 group G4]|nr:hypothetical protein E4U17_005625 [Claviceps sp. LM77 group G4]